MDNERIEKLPKWAQNKIYLLQSKVEELEQKLKTLKFETHDEGVYIKDCYGETYPIPAAEKILKKLINGDLEFNLSEKNKVKIYGYYSVLHELAIISPASNVLEIKIIKRR